MISRAIRIGAALLGLAAGTGFASEVDIVDLTDDLPTVTLSSDLSGLLSVTTTPENVTISGTIPFSPTAPPPIPIGFRSVGLVEPSSDPFNQPVSDVVTLGTDQITLPNGLGETIRLQFQSDAFGPPPLASNAPTLTETGLPQDVTTLLNSGGLKVVVTSDLGGSEPTPLPASAWSGLGLLTGLATWRIVRRRQARAAVN